MSKDSQKQVDQAKASSEEGNLIWHDLRDLGVEGRGWNDTGSFYDRLPARAEGIVREWVWKLSQMSAGMTARFITDATTIHVRYRLRFKEVYMWHMAPTGVSGIDLYTLHEGQWRWAGITRETVYPQTNTTLVSDFSPERRQYQVYLPLYNGVEDVEIGVPRGAAFEAAPPRPAEKSRPICFYGTSIVQGACASRPGMAHTNILGRRLDWPTLNLGFSGNGCMEIEVARFLAELDPSIYVIDCVPNMTAEMIDERLVPLAQHLRQAHPNTPLVFVDTVIYQHSPFCPSQYERSHSSNAAQRRALDQLVASGMKDLYHIPYNNLAGDDGEPTVDGAHLTDLGFFRFAGNLEPLLRKLLDCQI